MKTNSRVKRYSTYGEIRKRPDLSSINEESVLSDRSLMSIVGRPPYAFLREYYNL